MQTPCSSIFAGPTYSCYEEVCYFTSYNYNMQLCNFLIRICPIGVIMRLYKELLKRLLNIMMSTSLSMDGWMSLAIIIGL